jgi:hypothetical protein
MYRTERTGLPRDLGPLDEEQRHLWERIDAMGGPLMAGGSGAPASAKETAAAAGAVHVEPGVLATEAAAFVVGVLREPTA